MQTSVRIDGWETSKRFHNLKHPEWPEVDHYSKIPDENRNGLDNRDKHLRDGSGGINQGNRPLSSNNTSGVNGVFYNVTSKIWFVAFTTNGTRCPYRAYPGPNDKTHPSYRAACEHQKELAEAVGNMNGR